MRKERSTMLTVDAEETGHEERPTNLFRSLFDPEWCIADTPRRPWNVHLIAARQSKNFDVPYSAVLNAASQLSLFVDIHPEILGGTPRIVNTRIPIYAVLNAIEEYMNLQEMAKIDS